MLPAKIDVPMFYYKHHTPPNMPRKATTESKPETAAPAPAPAEEAPKKRGRKPKVAHEEAKPATEQAPAPAEEAPKKRGRKPKVAPEAPAAAPAPAPAPAEEEDKVNEEADPCAICLDKFTAVVRKPIACPSCQADTCAQCIKRYIVSTTDDPHCPHCKHGFDRMFLQTNLSKLYMNTTYAEHRAQVLWRREESFLPATQIKAERVRRGYKYRQEVIDPLEAHRAKIRKQIQELVTQMDQITGEIAWHEHDRMRLIAGEMTRAEAREAGQTVEDPTTKNRRTFARKCTSEGCHGWLSSAWKCGLCDNYTCPDCFIIKGKHHDVEHTCKKEDLDTAKLIRESSKPCPKCGEGIEKREGCDMMFCTSCHTPFSWKTLEIISRGSIHNPHYFEWRNRVGAGAVGAAHAAEPLPCGGMPTDQFIYRTISMGGATAPGAAQQYVLSFDTREALSRRFRVTTHIEHVVAPSYNHHQEIQNTERLRIQYLLNELNKESIETTLQNQERTRERHKAIRDVLDTYLVASAEQFRIVAANPTEETSATIIQSLDQLRDFINECLRNVHRTYGCTVPIILNDWTDTDSYTLAKDREQQRIEAREAADVELQGWIAEKAPLFKEVKQLRATLNLRTRTEAGFYRTQEYQQLQRDISNKEQNCWRIEGKINNKRNKYAEEDDKAKVTKREEKAKKKADAAAATVALAPVPQTA
jgi:hypothetical protein